MSTLYYLNFAEGFLIYEMQQGESRELIEVKGFTRDLRKATGTPCKQKAMGIAGFVIKSRESARKYFCIVQAAEY